MVIDMNGATKLLAIQPARVVRVLVKAVLLVCIPACSAIERILKIMEMESNKPKAITNKNVVDHMLLKHHKVIGWLQ